MKSELENHSEAKYIANFGEGCVKLFVKILLGLDPELLQIYDIPKKVLNNNWKRQ